MAPCQRCSLGFVRCRSAIHAIARRTDNLSPSFLPRGSHAMRARGAEGNGMDDVARVVLALETPQVAEEVLHFLDRSGLARVVATAEDGRQLADAVRQAEPDVVVAEPMLAIAGVGEAPLLALATRESVASLRAAVRAGAQSYYVWPGERNQLLDRVAGAGGERASAPERRATVVAVHGARGGVGCTFVATHLAEAVRRTGSACVLVDLDLRFGDLAPALGAGPDARSIADLIPVQGELGWEHIEGVLSSGAVLAPEVEALAAVDPELPRAVVETAAAHADAVIVHLPRHLDESGRWAFAQADRVVEVLSLDVASFRCATRALEMYPRDDGDASVDLLVNRAARGEITAADVRRVFGKDPIAVLPFEASVGRAQDHGRLVAPRSRLGRAFRRLAEGLLAAGNAEEAA
jgi:pilus assembly protein CpaE